MIELFSYSLSATEFGILFFAMVFIGMSKTGIPGAGMVSVPLVVIIFGSKASTGMILPLLIIADIVAIYHYNRYANWQHLRRLLPLTLFGVIIACVVGNAIDDSLFRNIMAMIIFAALGLMLWQTKGNKITPSDSYWFVAIVGILGGFASMIGNLAGPILALYLLAMRFPKNQFLGTGAWFFLCINIVKMPFHIYVWQTVTLNSVLFGALLIPAIGIGAFIGIKTAKKMPEKVFRYIVITATAVGAVAMYL